MYPTWPSNLLWVWAVCTAPIKWVWAVSTTPVIWRYCGHGLLLKEQQVWVSALVVYCLMTLMNSYCKWKQIWFKVVKMHTHVEHQVASYLLMCSYNWNPQSWVIPEIHQIGGEGNSFHSLHMYTTSYCLTKAAKAMQLHTSLSSEKIHRKIFN